MWKVIVFADDEVSAVPISWLIVIAGVLMCFWPKKDARLKRAKAENIFESGDEQYTLHECRVLMDDVTFTTFKEALVNEIRAQDVSHFDDGNESDGFNSIKKQVEDDEFEFKKVGKETLTIDVVETNKSKIQSLQSSSLVLNNDKAAGSESESSSLVVSKDVGDEVVTSNNTIVVLESVLEHNNVDKGEVPEKTGRIEIPNLVIVPGLNVAHGVEAFESSSTSEKLKAIFVNQMAEKKVYTELSNRLAGIEKHLKKYGGKAYTKIIEELTLQVSSVDMFSKLEDELEPATKTAVAEYFDKTIYEKQIKQFVKVLLNRFFEPKFYAHNVTGKSGGKVILNKSQTLSCIYESVERKFKKKKDEVEDTVFKAIDQLKDSLRKKFPKPAAEKKKKKFPNRKPS